MTTACDKKNATFRSAVLTIFQISEYSGLPDRMTYFAYGKETCPTTGRDHLQAFAYSENTMRITQWKKIFPTAHIEKMKGTFMDNVDYCSKQGQLVEFGVKPMANGHRRDLETACNMVMTGKSMYEVSKVLPVTFVQYHNGLTKLEVMHTQPYQHDTVRGVWYYGVPGAGKTHAVEYKFDDVYKKSQNKWFDGYHGQKTIFLDDFDCKHLGHYLKIWADKWSCTGEIKGGTVQLRHHYFVVTSNYSIEEMFPDDLQLQAAIKRRFAVTFFDRVYK